MEINTINAALFAKMFLAGAKNLESKKEWINELNVFPVPDGDTGTNMTGSCFSESSGDCIQSSYEAKGRHDPHSGKGCSRQSTGACRE